MKSKVILIFSLLFSLALIGQENPQSLTLQEAIDFALENNKQAKNAALDIEAAEKIKWETTASGLPQVNATIDYQNFLKQQVSLIPAEFFGGNPGDFEEVTFGTKQNVGAFATVTQKIFDGSYLVGLQSAKVYLEISENAKEKTDLEVRNAVINAYGNVLLAEESITILNNNIDVIQKNVDETTRIYENGMAEEESVEQLEITLSLLKSSLSNAERLKALAYQMFNITIGLDLNNNTTLTDNLEALTLQNMDLELLNADENVENTIDYKIAENDLESKELLVKLAKSKALPTLNAFLNGGYSGFNDEFNFLNKNQDWFGSSLFGVSMNIPIFSSLERSAATQRAEINLEKAETDLQLVEQQLSFKITRAKSDYQFAIEEYQNKKQNLNLAERIERKNQTKFFEGIGSSFDLRQAQTQLYSAQREYLEAMFNVISSKAELETVLNTIN
ncbi:TolC family protein [Yeosuana sp. MJ-SS3]|uniref:TolC family protein n=1 Tax=Gilvirhabdus luticola TaxID=3079858 RepID=A0ABU3U8G1_9FLAO|nr:TolC family protein [Yeosuana sp. MJ-SS3]MDU8886704.1 TolC family protein [Yeosuana sp. MJ-SS3]